MNTNEITQKAYDILKQKGRVSVEDIAIQFGISVSTAYNIFRILKVLCGNDKNCVEEKNGRKVILVYKTQETTPSPTQS